MKLLIEKKPKICRKTLQATAKNTPKTISTHKIRRKTAVYNPSNPLKIAVTCKPKKYFPKTCKLTSRQFL